MNSTIFKTSVGSTWDMLKPVRTSMPISGGKLTGRWEEHDLGGEKEVMLEVDHDFGRDFIFEQFISQ